MDKPRPNPNSSSSPTSTIKDVEGQELGEEERVWRDVATSEARLALMKNMVKENLAFADLEEFGINFDNKLKTEKLKNKTVHSKLTEYAMKIKIADEQVLRRELVKLKTKMRRNLIKKCGGEKTRKCKKILNHLNNITKETKIKLKSKYKMKMEHIKNKYRMEENEKVEEIPEDLEEFATLSVFSEEKYESLVKESYDVLTIGEVTLSDEERAVLKLHNKFSVLENIKKGEIDGDQEASIAKLRMEKVKDEEYEGYTEKERKEDENITAQGRMIYDPCEKVFDGRKRRVTDLKECTRVTLPKPLSAEEESKIEVRKRTQKEIFEKFRKNNTNSKGEQKSNLTQSEQKGLRSLRKRIKEGSIVIMKTDKSGRFVVTTPEKYIEIGKEHTDKDKEISWDEVRKLEKNIHAHSIAWAQIWSYGEDHDHQDRILRSKMARSGNQANLTLLYKDHKIGNKTRPVASGNESFNVGLSNGVSELLESVSKAIENPYAVISSEDMLARVAGFNTEEKSQPNLSQTELEKSQRNLSHNETSNIADQDLQIGPLKRKAPGPAGRSLGLIFPGAQSKINPTYCLPEPKLPGGSEEDINQSGTANDKSEAEEFCLIGCDVVALFPSLTSKRTGEIIRERIMKSRLKFEGFDYKQGRRYIVLNRDRTGNIGKLGKTLPWRKKEGGTKPSCRR